MANQEERYGMPLVLMHWLLAVFLIGILCVGWIMADLPKDDPLRPTLFFLHKSTGILILLLAALRLGVRMASRVPPPVAGMPGWEKTIAKLVVIALYALMFATPLAGWALSSAAGKPVPLYGLVEMPSLLAPDEQLAESLEELHETLAALFAGLIGLHIAAAFKHQFIDKDRLLLRMMPTKKD